MAYDKRDAKLDVHLDQQLVVSYVRKQERRRYVHNTANKKARSTGEGWLLDVLWAGTFGFAQP